MNFKSKLCECRFFTCKNLGTAVFSFCLGMSAGMFFPVEFVAVLEAAMLLFLAYLCVFHW